MERQLEIETCQNEQSRVHTFFFLQHDDGRKIRSRIQQDMLVETVLFVFTDLNLISITSNRILLLFNTFKYQIFLYGRD